MILPQDPQIVCHFSDAETGLRAYLVIDACPPGGACGGVRAHEGVTLEEVTALARKMTLKYRFMGLPLGGAKAGIVMPRNIEREEWARMLQAFGSHAEPLLTKEIFYPWTDMNTGPWEMNQILAGAGLAATDWPDSGHYTALTVVAALRACCEARGIELNGLTVAIEGFGSVGSRVAAELHQLGAKVVAISTIDGALHDPAGLDIVGLLNLRRTHGSRLVHFADARRIPQAELLELPVDVLIPAAGPWTINSTNVRRIEARIIAPAANIPIAADVEDQLSAAPRDVLPDFVCNCGGALGSYLEKRGFDAATVRTKLSDDFRRIVRNLISEDRLTDPPADALAELTWL